MESLRAQKLPFSSKKLPKRVIFSYILDYVIIIALIIGFYALDAVEPFHQHFSLQNYTLHYPFAVKERVPIFALLMIAIVAPAIIIAFYTLVLDGLFAHADPMQPSGRRRRRKYELRDRLWELNCGILGLLLASGAAFTITGTLKNAIGKPRPDLIARCIPPPGAVDPPPFRLSDHSICTQTDNAILKDGFRSFPSGHSSSSFAGLFYLSLYLAAKLHVLDSKGEVWKAFIVLVPTLAASLVAGSRIMDARHHPFDVLSGSLIGILVAWGSYRQYFPPLSETWLKGRAHPIRTWARGPQPPPSMATVPTSFAAGEDLQPLHLVQKLADEEQQHHQHPGSSTALDDPNHAADSTNVFRAQVSRSQRQRQLHFDRANTASSTYSQPGNPFTQPRSGAGNARRLGDWDELSSEEEEEAYELQPTPGFPQHGAGAPDLSGPTAYDPPIGKAPASALPKVQVEAPTSSSGEGNKVADEAKAMGRKEGALVDMGERF